jgi:nitrate/nitrite transport system substrate-binding protein
MAELGKEAPAAEPKIKVMGREFDPAKADEYARSFPINRLAA